MSLRDILYPAGYIIPLYKLFLVLEGDLNTIQEVFKDGLNDKESLFKFLSDNGIESKDDNNRNTNINKNWTEIFFEIINELVSIGYSYEEAKNLTYPEVKEILKANKNKKENEFIERVYSTFIGSQCDAVKWLRNRKYDGIEIGEVIKDSY